MEKETSRFSKRCSDWCRRHSLKVPAISSDQRPCKFTLVVLPQRAGAGGMKHL
jgi:hypothetical protein